MLFQLLSAHIAICFKVTKTEKLIHTPVYMGDPHFELSWAEDSESSPQANYIK